MKIPATPKTVKNFLEDAGLNFCKYNKLNIPKKDCWPLIKFSECMSYDNKYTIYDLKWLYGAIEGFMNLSN